jgi:hypothetical protein
LQVRNTVVESQWARTRDDGAVLSIGKLTVEQSRY